MTVHFTGPVVSTTGVTATAGNIAASAGNVTASGTVTAGTGIANAAGLITGSAVDALTALVGGAQAGTALTAQINRITTVASAADSVQLPVSTPGMMITVINSAATNACAVFGQTGDTINAIAANSAFSLVAGKCAIFTCAVAGKWHSTLTA